MSWRVHYCTIQCTKAQMELLDITVSDCESFLMWHQLNWQRRKAWNWVCLQNTMFATRRHHTGPSLSSFTADFTPHKHQRFRLTLFKNSELAWSWYVLVTIANLNFLFDMHHPWTSHRFLSVLWTGWSQVSRILATLSLPKICIKVVCRCLYSNILHFDILHCRVF